MNHKVIPIAEIRCASCKHFKKLKKPPYESANPIIAICEAHGDYLKAYEWIEFAKNCKEYEVKR